MKTIFFYYVCAGLVFLIVYQISQYILNKMCKSKNIDDTAFMSIYADSINENVPFLGHVEFTEEERKMETTLIKKMIAKAVVILIWPLIAGIEINVYIKMLKKWKG